MGGWRVRITGTTQQEGRGTGIGNLVASEQGLFSSRGSFDYLGSRVPFEQFFLKPLKAYGDSVNIHGTLFFRTEI